MSLCGKVDKVGVGITFENHTQDEKLDSPNHSLLSRCLLVWHFLQFSIYTSKMLLYKKVGIGLVKCTEHQTSKRRNKNELHCPHEPCRVSTP